MDLEKIRELLKIVAESGLAEVEMEIGDDLVKLVVRRNASAPPEATPATEGMAKTPPALAASDALSETTLNEPEEPLSPTTEGILVTAPLVGTFYRAPAPDADSFVDIGDRVQRGDTLCIIEAMKVMNEIESEVAGIIKQILVENEKAVEYEQPLFVIDPA